MAQYSSRQIGGTLVVLIGLFVLATAVLVNPWVGRLWRGPYVVDFADVMLGYFVWAMLLGTALVLMGRAVSRRRSRLDGLTTLLVVITGVILLDRMLLVKYGLPLWRYDSELQFRHRPNVTRLPVPRRPHTLYHINSHGFHDDPFPVEKPPGEFRALALGDSCTMGLGVNIPQTFCGRLEKLLGEIDTRYRSHQVINTGVHGYATAQEAAVLKQTLRFQPDLVVLGFCMNDVTEPYVKDRGLGGTGMDYHGAQTTGPLTGYLVNETGFGRLFQQLRRPAATLHEAKRLEAYNVRDMAMLSESEPRYKEAWRATFAALEDIYSTARLNRIPAVLVIFPFDFQLVEEDTCGPQRMLADHAARHGADVIDTTPAFRKLVLDDPELLAAMRARKYDDDEIRKFFRWKIDRYYLDQNHFTPEGHAVVAQLLLEYLEERRFAGPARPSTRPAE